MSTILTFEGLSAYDEEIKALIEKNIDELLTNQSDTSNKTITWDENETVYTQTWTKDNKKYQKIHKVSDTVITMQLVIDGKNAGLWKTTIDETNRKIDTVYTKQ